MFRKHNILLLSLMKYPENTHDEGHDEGKGDPLLYYTCCTY